MMLYAVMMDDYDDIRTIVGIFSDEKLADEVASSCQHSAWTETLHLDAMPTLLAYDFRTEEQRAAAYAAMLVRQEHQFKTLRETGAWGL